jgi:polyhydroxyalkanoate synthase subunit PhaC
MVRETIPSIDFDIEKELKRWRKFVNILNDAEPMVGQTPKNVVWKKNKATLLHYPAVEKKYETPIFLVYSLFNRSYLLDLAPGLSVIEGLVNKGYEVYLLDWGIAGPEDQDINLETYVMDYIKKGVQRALRHSGADGISLIGYCLGGTLASIYTSIAEEPIKNLIAATSPFNFEPVSMPDKWAEGFKNDAFNLERMLDVHSIIPSEYVQAFFRGMGSPIYFSPYVSLMNRIDDDKFVEKWRRVNKWTNEHVPFTREAFRQFNNDLARNNKFFKGEFTVRGRKADLANIKSNFLAVASKNDHLVIEEQVAPVMDKVSSEDKTYKLIDAGHASYAINGQFSEIVDSWLSTRS